MVVDEKLLQADDEEMDAWEEVVAETAGERLDSY